MTKRRNRPGDDADIDTDTDNPLRKLALDDAQLRRIVALLALNEVHERKSGENKPEAA